MPESRVTPGGNIARQHPTNRFGHASADEHRSLMSKFPTGVAVVTSVDSSHRPHGITCSSLVSVTLTPPTLLVCIWFGSPTLAALKASGDFAVNLLHARARRTAELFSTPMADRFAEIGWCRSPRSGLPWLHRDAFAFAECRLTESVEAGDHVLVLGEVFAVAQHDDEPLLYGMRRFSAWPALSAEAYPTV